MISGPDLGGGFLFQLTRESGVSGPRYTYHAQYGGVDAQGPPKGSPEPFGYQPDPGMCPIGGRRCYHRSFDLASVDDLAVRSVYNRMRFVIRTLLDQSYGQTPVPLERALVEVLRRVPSQGPTLEATWAVAGAAARWVGDGESPPQRLELVSSNAGARILGDALSELLTEPVAFTVWRSGQVVLGGRAFVGSFREGALVEWIAEGRSKVGVPQRPLSDARIVEWNSFHVPVV